MTKLTFIDLFGAPGGMSLGFKFAGLKPVGALDIYEQGIDTFRKNFPGVPKKNVVLGDAGTRGMVKKFKTITGLRRGDVDLIIGGPPCQGFSTIGRIKIASLVKNGQREGRSSDARFIDDKRNFLYKAFIKFVKFYQPLAVVMENVQGMSSYRGGLVVKQIKNDFRNAGFKNVDSQVIDAADYGVPQHRKRIFFIATRDGHKLSWPLQTHFAKSQFDRSLIDPNAKEHVTVWDALGDLPRVIKPSKGKKIMDIPISYDRKPGCEYQKWLRKGTNKLHNHITRWHRKKDHIVFSHMKPGQRWLELSSKDRRLIGYSDDSFEDKWKRLPMNQPSWTVVSHIQKDGYMYIHPKQNRTISVREAARLQSFPDYFVFAGSRSSQFKQIGNAVPPLLAMAVAKKVKGILASG